MAVTFHNATVTAGPASVGTATILHTISGADACLLVFTHANTAISISAIAANGLSLSRLGHISASSSRAEVWGLTDAPLATLSISVNTVGAASLDFCLIAISYIGQQQHGASPFGTVVAGTAQAVANVAFSVSSTSTDMVVYGFGLSANTTVAFNTGTSRGNTTHTTTGRLVVGEITGAATISISATAAIAGTWSFLGVPIVASAAPNTSIRFDNAAYTSDTVLANSRGLLLTAATQAVLLVNTVNGTNNIAISAINAGSQQLTFLGAIDFGTSRAELWGLTAPASGILTISAALAGAATAQWGFNGITYTGHRLVSPFGGVASGSAPSVASAALTVSSTVGNVAVFFFAANANASGTVGPGVIQRLATPSTIFNGFVVGDVAGALAVTATVSKSSAVFWGNLGINLIQQGTVSGAAAMTDLRGTLSATGYVVVSGRMSATDVVGTFTATGYTIVSGRLSATGAADKLSASGYVVVSGRMSATGAADTFSASGYNLISGRLSATDVTDRFSVSGYVLVSGRLSATDVTDKFSASGTVVQTGNITGRLSATEAADTFSASGYVLVQGSVAFTDRPDIFSASGTVVTTVAAPAPAPDTPSLGGKKQKKTEYFRADDAFWDAREKYLLSLQPAIASEPEYEPSTIHAELPNTVPSHVDPSLLIQYRATRSKIVQALPAASSMRQLKAQGKRLYEVNARIAEQKRLQAAFDAEQDRAKLAKEARQRKRAQDIRRLKRRVKLLAVARAAVALTYLLDKL